MESLGFCANETLLEQSLHEMEMPMLTADSDYDHSFSELSVHKSLICPEGHGPCPNPCLTKCSRVFDRHWVLPSEGLSPFGDMFASCRTECACANLVPLEPSSNCLS